MSSCLEKSFCNLIFKAVNAERYIDKFSSLAEKLKLNRAYILFQLCKSVGFHVLERIRTIEEQFFQTLLTR